MAEKRKRDTIILTPEQHESICQESYFEVDSNLINVEVVENEHDDTGRHQEYHHIVFKHPNGCFYIIDYSNSVKDEMGWNECNISSEYTAQQVFPKQITTTIYE